MRGFVLAGSIIVSACSSQPPPTVVAVATPAPGGFEPAERLVGRWVSLRSVNYRQNFVRHQNGLGEMSPLQSDLDRSDGSFHVVAGMARAGTVSFESFNYPGFFLRSEEGRIKLARADGTDPFRQDASFVPEPGAAGEGTTFRSATSPERAIRHCAGHLFVDKNDKTNAACDPDTFRSDISFVVENAPMGPSGAVSAPAQPTSAPARCAPKACPMDSTCQCIPLPPCSSQACPDGGRRDAMNNCKCAP